MAMANAEQIYAVWLECGQNVAATVRALKEKGFEAVTRQTLAKWIEDNGWKDRAAREAAAEKEIQTLSRDDVSLVLLSKQCVKYEAYFDKLPADKVDNQATYAYTNILSQMTVIRQRTTEYKVAVFSDFLRDFIDYAAIEDQEAKAVLERHFEGFVKATRAKYGV